MGEQVQWRGGPTAQASVFVGRPKEITVDTDKWVMCVHDGITPGGHELGAVGPAPNHQWTGTILAFDDGEGNYSDGVDLRSALTQQEIDAITAEGATQIGLITTEGTTQVGSVQTEGATQIALATAQADAAVTSASNAATSETNANNSATAASTSESNAAASATAASTSETNTATSETNAANSATAAGTSETNAAASASAAASSAAAATTSEANAATSESVAMSAANYKGEWNTLSGVLNIPASVSHLGSIYVLKNNVADVALTEPGVTADWLSIVSAYSASEIDGFLAGKLGVDAQAADSVLLGGKTEAQLNVLNADTADKLSIARDITLDGDVTGTASFNGSQNVTITTTVQSSGMNPIAAALIFG